MQGGGKRSSIESCPEGKGVVSCIGPEELVEEAEVLWRALGGRGSPKRIGELVRSRIGPNPTGGLLIDILETRERSLQKYEEGERLFFTNRGLRWATPQSAAVHCADRLSCGMCFDLACGQGGQTLFLSRTCDEVKAVELDPLNLLIARANGISLGLDNVEWVRGDVLDEEVAARLGGCDHLFSDPSRPPGSRERSMDEIEPDPREVLSLYGERAEGFCFEVPPYMSLDRVPFPHEAEYISIEGRLNRLNLYTGDLISAQRSAVSFPSGERMSGFPANVGFSAWTTQLTGRYLYEVDPALVRAGLLSTLLNNITGVSPLSPDSRRTLLLSDRPTTLPMLSRGYLFRGVFEGKEAMISALRGLNAGKVVLRWEVDPERYWDVRKEIEGRLKGDAKFHVFMRDGIYMIGEEISKVGNAD